MYIALKIHHYKKLHLWQQALSPKLLSTMIDEDNTRAGTFSSQDIFTVRVLFFLLNVFMSRQGQPFAISDNHDQAAQAFCHFQPSADKDVRAGWGRQACRFLDDPWLTVVQSMKTKQYK